MVEDRVRRTAVLGGDVRIHESLFEGLTADLAGKLPGPVVLHRVGTDELPGEGSRPLHRFRLFRTRAEIHHLSFRTSMSFGGSSAKSATQSRMSIGGSKSISGWYDVPAKSLATEGDPQPEGREREDHRAIADDHRQAAERRNRNRTGVPNHDPELDTHQQDQRHRQRELDAVARRPVDVHVIAFGDPRQGRRNREDQHADQRPTEQQSPHVRSRRAYRRAHGLEHEAQCRQGRTCNNAVNHDRVNMQRSVIHEEPPPVALYHNSLIVHIIHWANENDDHLCRFFLTLRIHPPCQMITSMDGGRELSGTPSSARAILLPSMLFSEETCEILKGRFATS